MADDPTTVDWTKVGELAQQKASGVDWSAVGKKAQEKVGGGFVDSAYKTFVKPSVDVTRDYIVKPAWEGYKGVADLMNPNVHVEKWRQEKFGVGEDVPGKPGMKYYPDRKEPDTGYTEPAPDFSKYQTWDEKQFPGRNTEEAYQDQAFKKVFGKAAKEAVAVPLQTSARVLGVPDEVPDFIAEKLLGEKAPKNFWTTTMPELAGFAKIAGTISKELMLSKTLKAAMTEGRAAAPVVREGIAVGAEAARREYAKTGDWKQSVKAFYANFPIGATIGLGEGLKIRGEASLPKAPQEAWMVDKNLADNQARISEFRARQEAKARSVQDYRDAMNMPGSRIAGEKPGSVTLGPQKMSPRIPEDPYQRVGMSETTGETFQKDSIKLGPEKIERPVSENPYERDYRSPGGGTRLYSGVPLDEVANILGENHPVGKMFRGKGILEDRARGYDPKTPPSGVEAFARKWFGNPGEDRPKGWAEDMRSLREENAGSYAMAEELGAIARMPEGPAKVSLEKVIRGEVVGTEPSFVLEAGANGVPRSRLNVAIAARTKLNEVQDALVREGLLSVEAATKFRKTYLRRLWKEYLDPVGMGRGGGVKKIFKRREDFSPEWVEKNIVDSPSLQAAVGIPQDIQRLGKKRLFTNALNDATTTLPKEMEGNLKVDANGTGKINGLSYEKLEGVDPASLPEGTTARAAAETFGLSGLQGRWVLKDVAQDVKSMMAIPGEVHGAMKALDTYLRVRGWWKVGKAAINTANSVGNVMYNMFILDQAMPHASPYLPSGAKFLKMAWSDVFQKSPEYLEQKMHGTFGGHFGVGEVDRAVADILGKSDVGSMGGMMNVLDSLAQKSAAHYRLSEEVFKMAYARYLIEVEGMGAKQASRLSRKHFFDYGDVPKAVRIARNFPGGPAFITFQTKAIPRAVEYVAASSNPANLKMMVKFWKYPAAVKMMHEYNKDRLGVTDEDIQKDMLNMPKYAPRVMMLFGKGEDGSREYFDTRYVLPFMDLVGKKNEAFGWNLLYGSGPEYSIWEVISNKRRFDDREIVPGGKEWGWDKANLEGKLTSAGKLGKHFSRTLLPQAVVSGMNIAEAAGGAKDIKGEPRRNLKQDIYRAAGIPLMIPKEGTKERNVMESKQGFDKYVRGIRNNRDMSQEKKLRLIKQAILEMNKTTKTLLSGGE